MLGRQNCTGQRAVFLGVQNHKASEYDPWLPVQTAGKIKGNWGDRWSGMPSSCGRMLEACAAWSLFGCRGFGGAVETAFWQKSAAVAPFLRPLWASGVPHIACQSLVG